MAIEISSSQLIATGILLLLSIFGAILVQLVYRRLEINHPDEWVELGKPNILKFSTSGAWRILKYSFGKHESGKADSRLRLLVGASIGCSATILIQMAYVSFVL